MSERPRPTRVTEVLAGQLGSFIYCRALVAELIQCQSSNQVRAKQGRWANRLALSDSRPNYPPVYSVPPPPPEFVTTSSARPHRPRSCWTCAFLHLLGCGAGSTGPATIRIIGSAYDSAVDCDYSMRVGSLSGSFDVIAYVQTTTAAQRLR
jgi:hypothetical protein